MFKISSHTDGQDISSRHVYMTFATQPVFSLQLEDNE